MRSLLWRGTVITHRYLGVAIGLLMFVWFFSGIVMMYVNFPSLDRDERIRSLSPIDWQACCSLAAQPYGDDQPVRSVEIQSVSGEPAMKLRPEGQPQSVSSLGAAGASLELDMTRARAIVAEAAPRITGGSADTIVAEQIDLDQWTVGAQFNPHRPLYHFAFDDPARTRLYVSSTTGEVLLWTTRAERFWNWLGSIPHWIYPTVLRRNGPLWAQVVIWTSIIGGFLTVIGLYLGIAQFKRGASGRLSPYRGWFYWHHITGLFFGILTLTWVISGTFSMDPFGFLADRPTNERVRLAGEPVPWSDVRASLAAIQANPPAGNTVLLTSAPVAGRLYWLATDENGAVQRLDAAGRPAPVGRQELQEIAGLLAAGDLIMSQEIRMVEDEYYYTLHDPVVLPVYRVTVEDGESTRYYIDPATGTLLRRVNANDRAERWLFSSLHHLDFPVLRWRPLWDIVVVLLMLGGTALSATGVYLAFWRIKRDFTFARRTRAVRQPAE
jgi:uncharacterized iron-regulated membrane protein